MSCECSIVATGCAEPLVRAAVARLHDLESTWSRFIRSSEISGLNHAAGEARHVRADTVRLVTALVQAWYATDGAFDPTLLGTLVELGYAASRDDVTVRTSLATSTRPQGRPDAILVDPDARIVRLPPGTTLDPGGLGKGLAADIVTAELVASGASGALVEIGGDVRVVGTPPDSTAWPISIRPALDGEPIRVVDVADGGIATSTSRLRTWTRDGRRHHHLIDPRTLRAAVRDTVSCTVIAGSAAWAETFTKVAFACDVDEAIERFEGRGLAASITTATGDHRTTGAWEDFVR